MTTNPQSTVETRQARFVARRHDALVEIIQAHPYSSVAVLVALAERDERLRVGTWVGLEQMLAELLVNKRIRRGGTTRQALYSVEGAAQVLADRQAERDASGQLARVTVPTPPVPTRKGVSTTGTDGRQLARLAATTSKIGGPELVVGLDAEADAAVDVVVEVAINEDARGEVQDKHATGAPTRTSGSRKLKPESGTSRMVAYIEEHPYCVSADIVRDLGLSHSIVSTSLKTHADSNRSPRISRARGDDGSYRWFMTNDPERGAEQRHVDRSTGGHHWRTGVRTEAVDPTSATGRLAAWVVAHPGYTARQIAAACGMEAPKAGTLLALHHKSGRKPQLVRVQVAGIYIWRGADALAEQDAAAATEQIEATDEAGVSPHEAPVESDDGAGPSEAVPTASEASSEDLQLVSDLMRRVMDLTERCDSWKGVARRRQATVDNHRAVQNDACIRILRLLGNEADVEHQSGTLDELLTSLEARVRNLEACDARPARIDALVDYDRLVSYLRRAHPQRTREGESVAGQVTRMMGEDAWRTRTVAWLLVGGEVSHS